MKYSKRVFTIDTNIIYDISIHNLVTQKAVTVNFNALKEDKFFFQ